MRTLTPNQTYDPGRGSFLIRPRMIKQTRNGDRVFIAPTEPVKGNAETYETFSNAIQFKPVQLER